ncbi:MAG: HNH endonuclease, partial [Actinomycetales bacterium]|nr:HNH endonuclease [Actinomycetales bacterium]
MFDRSVSTADPSTGAPAVLGSLDALAERGAELASAGGGYERWSGRDRGRALRALDRLAGALATVRAELLVAERAARTSVRPGDRDFESARARATRTGLGEARREVRQAEALVALPAVAQAVRDGVVPLPHVDALARASVHAGDEARAALASAEVQDRLVGLARHQTVKEFTASVARIVAEHEPDAVERSAAAQRRARFFVMSHQPEGTFLRGRLDHLAAESLRVAIAAVGMAPDKERDKPQADADALVALAERATAGMAGVRARRSDPNGLPLPDGGQDAADARISGVANRPSVSVLVPAETFVELRETQRRREAGEAEAFAPVPPAMLESGMPVAMSQLARMLCDCEVGRIVMSADGLPMDLGRTQRLYTGAQRRAVIVRDRACAWQGCDVPAAYCEVHHIRWWDRDLGPTSVENGVLLCSHHHQSVHALDLSIRRRSGPVRYEFTTRDGRVISGPPGGAPPGGAPPGGAPPGGAPPGGAPPGGAPP